MPNVCSNSSTKGTTLLEAVIILPIFLLFLAAIFDISWILTQRIALSQAVLRASRAAAVEPADCVTGPRQVLTSYLGQLRFTHLVEEFEQNPSHFTVSLSTIPVTNGAGTHIVNGIELQVVSNIPCYFCQVLSALGGTTVRYNTVHFTVREVQTACRVGS